VQQEGRQKNVHLKLIGICLGLYSPLAICPLLWPQETLEFLERMIEHIVLEPNVGGNSFRVVGSAVVTLGHWPIVSDRESKCNAHRRGCHRSTCVVTLWEAKIWSISQPYNPRNLLKVLDL